MTSKLVHFIIGPALFGATFLLESFEINFQAIGVAVWMVYWWMTQPVPLYMTAFLPLILGPATGLISDVELAQSYGNKMVFLFFGGFVLALAIEKRGLHKQLARMIIKSFGGTPSRLLLSFMMATALLSMWISNTATTLMMLPLALSVVAAIPRFRRKKRFALALLLGLAYSANIGGTATLIGTPPNVQLAGVLKQEFGIQVTFMQWMSVGLPFMLVALTLCFFVLKLLFLKNVRFEVPLMKAEPLSTNQKRVLLIFTLVSGLWIAGTYINELLPFKWNDTMTAILGAFLLFIVPAKEDKSAALLDWKDMKQLPWGILFLFGGGLALAAMLSNGGVVEAVVDGLHSFDQLPVILLLFLLFTIVILSTELMSNLALVSLLLPVIGRFALESGLPLFHVCAGVALCSSCAFMLPVATPPNAIVYSSKMIPMNSMIKVGLLLNLITVSLVTMLVFWMVLGFAH